MGRGCKENFLVKWLNLSINDSTWECACSLEIAEQLEIMQNAEQSISNDFRLKYQGKLDLFNSRYCNKGQINLKENRKY